tara:strand:+ start:76 stop:633 length:558 start_codon:yes stop_codon:yes gene_type:complete
MSDSSFDSDYDYADGFVVHDDDPIEYVTDDESMEIELELSEDDTDVSISNIITGTRSRRPTRRNDYLREKLAEEGLLEEYDNVTSDEEYGDFEECTTDSDSEYIEQIEDEDENYDSNEEIILYIEETDDEELMSEDEDPENPEDPEDPEEPEVSDSNTQTETETETPEVVTQPTETNETQTEPSA